VNPVESSISPEFFVKERFSNVGILRPDKDSSKHCESALLLLSWSVELNGDVLCSFNPKRLIFALTF